jgi:hypothetical protein
MRKSFICALFCLLHANFLNSQNKIKIADPDESVVIEKWIKACVNLEVRPNLFTSKKWDEMYRKSLKHQLTKNESWRIQDSTFHARYSGTAIYLLYNNKHYLLTARHVIEDTSSYYPDVYEFIYLRENGSDLAKGKSLDSVRTTLNLTLRRPLNEVPLILSDKKTDLAIISLENAGYLGKQFIQVLNWEGYIPIKLEDIDTTDDLKQNDLIFSFGFPQFSEVARLELPTNVFGNEILKATIPVVTKGYIQDVRKDSIDFTGNIFIYHGFSGGPVVKNNKMIGVNNSYQTELWKFNTPQLNYYIKEKSVFSKAKFIMPLIRELEKRLSTATIPRKSG